MLFNRRDDGRLFHQAPSRKEVQEVLSSDHEKESAFVDAHIKLKQMPIEQQKCVKQTFRRMNGERQMCQVQSHE